MNPAETVPPPATATASSRGDAPKVATLAPAPPSLIQNVSARKHVDLGGDWRTIIDPFENGYYDYRYQPRTQEGYFADEKPKSKSDRVEYDFDRAETLKVPGDWNSQRAELLFYEGTIWYRRRFAHVPTAGRRTFVHFGAANYDAQVYLNGQWVGHHVGGFTPFDFEIGDLLSSGDNSLPRRRLFEPRAHRKRARR